MCQFLLQPGLLRASNRGRAPVTLDVRAEGLAGATVEGLSDPLLPPGQERNYDLVVRVPRDRVAGSVTPFTWVLSPLAR